MEFRLNKIEPDIRRKINEAADECKVHPKKDIQINKDKERDRSEQQARKYKVKMQSKNLNKKIIINAEKNTNVNIDGFISDEEDIKIKKGVFLDIKK